MTSGHTGRNSGRVGCLFTNVAVYVMLILLPASLGADILSTKHNLSVSGPGTIKAVDESRVCIFCHTPHHASAELPLWSREMSTAIYSPYQSQTLVATPGQPTGGSRLCLSCHDGTIALGMLYNSADEIVMQDGVTSMPAGVSNLETDLSDDHPISFSYTNTLAINSGELANPSALPVEIRLEQDEYLQCSTCHDAHKDPYGKFLVMDNTASALCRECHGMHGFKDSDHATDAGLASDACRNCHQSHLAPGSDFLLGAAVEEDNCTGACHNGTGPGLNVAADFQKIFAHPLDWAAGTHQPNEAPLTMSKHVECVDCHDPHQVSSVDGSLSTPPDINALLQGVSGIDASGVEIAEVVMEYEICYKCHADNSFVTAVAVPRQVENVNERLRFDSGNPSYHPVTSAGKGTDVPSLRPGYSIDSRIYCVDCHGSDSSVKAGGTGPNGPHGSIYPPLLRDEYRYDTYPLAYAASNYLLCFNCHDPNILFDPFTSPFGPHQSHVQTHEVPCSVCHDPHGVSAQDGGNDTNNAHLVNFDTRYVTGGSDHYDAVARSCVVSCHSTNPQTY